MASVKKILTNFLSNNKKTIFILSVLIIHTINMLFTNASNICYLQIIKVILHNNKFFSAFLIAN